MRRPRTATESFGHRAFACSLALAVAGFVSSPCAIAQTSTYQLNDDGQWLQSKSAPPGTDEEKIAQARQLLADGKPSAARALMNDWLEVNEETDNPWLADALLVRGDARVATNSEYWALYDYEEICKFHRGSDLFALAVEREFEIGKRYLNGLRTKFIWMRLQERLPGSTIAEKACLELADYYYRTRQLAAAGDAYDIFLQLYPKSEFRQKAMQRRVYANIAKFKGPKYDASGLTEAKYLIKGFADRYPAEAERAGMNDGLVARLDESAAVQMLEIARWYIRRDDPVSARLTLERLQRKHPQTVAASQARSLLIERGWLKTENAEVVPAPAAPATTSAARPTEPEKHPSNDPKNGGEK